MFVLYSDSLHRVCIMHESSVKYTIQGCPKNKPVFLWLLTSLKCVNQFPSFLVTNISINWHLFIYLFFCLFIYLFIYFRQFFIRWRHSDVDSFWATLCIHRPVYYINQSRFTSRSSFGNDDNNTLKQYKLSHQASYR